MSNDIANCQYCDEGLLTLCDVCGNNRKYNCLKYEKRGGNDD